MCQEIEIPLDGNDEKRTQIIHRQEEVCKIMIHICKETESVEIRYKKLKPAIDNGFAKALLHIFEKQELNTISASHVQAFHTLTYYGSYNTLQQIYNLGPYKGLIRLLDHSNTEVIEVVIQSILHIISYGKDSVQDIRLPHPHYDEFDGRGGITKLFALFKDNPNQTQRYYLAFCIGCIYRAQEVTNPEIKRDVFTYLKSILNTRIDDIKGGALYALTGLIQNEINKAEIQKEGFKVPD
ncbi:MAG: hypothetical protein EZS28_007168 [Streblomastix strix]|uniref:Uncharacterized protein n=1 Tax=Streblomastix strix TaxID=222440 RepID=A0A5J4WR94_9EUKA|nr:MAG: hypothetical protein EZS28_007168 [Streblomastix strix]